MFKDDQARAKEQQQQVLKVAQAELKSLKPGRAVYQQRGNVLMLSSRDAALDTVDAKLAALGSK